MNDPTRYLSHSQDVATKVARLYQARVKHAQEQYSERVQKAWRDQVEGLAARPMTPWEVWTGAAQYAVDFAQRSVLFWDYGKGGLTHIPRMIALARAAGRPVPLMAPSP